MTVDVPGRPYNLATLQPMPLGPGDRLESYEIVAPLGAGGMGQVWLATDLRLQRQVAIKVLPAEVTRDASRVARFQQEARAASALNHPNVCTGPAVTERPMDGYTSNVSGTLEVYVETVPAQQGRWQISTAGGSEPHCRRDGKELFYIAADRTLMAVPVKAESAFEAGIPVPLFRAPVSVGIVPYPATYDVSADGQRFLMNAIVEEAPVSRVAVVVNWEAELKKQCRRYLLPGAGCSRS